METKYKYPTKYELTEAISMCKRRFVDEFAQRKGIFVYRATQAYLANQLSKLFLDEIDLELIRRNAHRNKNKKVTVGFVLTATDPHFDPKEVIDGLRTNPSRPNDKLSPITETAEGFQKGSLEYEVNKPGRIDLLQNEKRDVDYSIERKEGNIYQVFVDAHSSSDARYFEAMFKGAVKDEANVNIIDFEMLSAMQTVRFFDDLSELGLGDRWRKTRVNELTFRRPVPTPDDEGEEHQDASEEVLSVINRAILEGKDLRENEFVKQSENAGYRFSAMTIEYEHLKRPNIVEMRAEFKLRPEIFEIKVSSYKKRVLEGAAERVETDEVSEELDKELTTTFWYNAKQVYDNLLAVEDDVSTAEPASV
jgi:hypothetical protein